MAQVFNLFTGNLSANVTIWVREGTFNLLEMGFFRAIKMASFKLSTYSNQGSQVIPQSAYWMVVSSVNPYHPHT